MKWAGICVQQPLSLFSPDPPTFLYIVMSWLHPMFKVKAGKETEAHKSIKIILTCLSASFFLVWTFILYPSMTTSPTVKSHKLTQIIEGWLAKESGQVQKSKPSPSPYRPQGNRTRAGGAISQFCDLLLLLLYLICQGLDLSSEVSYLISIVLSFLKTQWEKVRVEPRLDFQPFSSVIMILQLSEYHQH